jgi:hypothetical protein
MRLAILAVAILIGIAGGAQANNKPGSGMNEAKCLSAWTMASPNGDAISKEKAAPYVIDFIDGRY